MINTIHIQNYILIDDLTIDFSKNLNVITGETGAGKSILINAIDIVFGAKVSGDIIKKDKDRAIIELFISNNNQNLKQIFEENFIEYTDEIIIAKEITPTSSRTRVNGTVVNQNFIKNIREIILDIHTQHQTYFFLQPKSHIVLLDNYSKDKYGEVLQTYKALYNNYIDLKKEYENTSAITDETIKIIDFKNFQINEIEDANLDNANEDTELKEELNVLENAQSLKELTSSAYFAMNGEDNGIIDSLSQVKKNISKAASIDNRLIDIETTMTDIYELSKDLTTELRTYSQSVSSDLQRIDEIQERLDLINQLKRKYGNNISEIIEYKNKLITELNDIEYSTKRKEDLEYQISSILNQIEKTATILSDKRKENAKMLSSKIEKELEKLDLEKSRFEIKVEDCELNQRGKDHIEFHIKTNVSQDLTPLAECASGGELSRIMLAIKTIFAETDNIDTVIFDEIDTGISGKAAQSVSEEIAKLSKYRQIICITHQAMIAAKADKNFFVSKKQAQETTVEIKTLNESEKISAIAKLASGKETEASIEFAKSLMFQ